MEKEDKLKQLKSELAALDRKIQLELAPPVPEVAERRMTGRRSSRIRKVYGTYRHNQPKMLRRYAARRMTEVRLGISLPIISLSDGRDSYANRKE